MYKRNVHVHEFCLLTLGLQIQVFRKSPFDGLLLKNRDYGNCLHAIPLQKNCKKILASKSRQPC